MKGHIPTIDPQTRSLLPAPILMQGHMVPKECVLLVLGLSLRQSDLLPRRRYATSVTHTPSGIDDGLGDGLGEGLCDGLGLDDGLGDGLDKGLDAGDEFVRFDCTRNFHISDSTSASRTRGSQNSLKKRM